MKEHEKNNRKVTRKTHIDITNTESLKMTYLLRDKNDNTIKMLRRLNYSKKN